MENKHIKILIAYMYMQCNTTSLLKYKFPKIMEFLFWLHLYLGRISATAMLFIVK